MNLLVYSAYYEPEVAASMYLSTNLYEDFAASGMNVRLYVPLPTRGVSDAVRNKYKGKTEKKENDRLEIIRLNIPKEGKNSIKRAFRYLWMNLVFIHASQKYDADAIFVQSTPPTQGAMAAIIKRRKKIPFIYNLQDVFPDSLVGAGMTTEHSVLYKIGRVIENYTYKSADKIIVISNDIKRNVMDKGVPAEKIVVIPNWIDSEVVHPVAKESNYLYEKYGIAKDKFTVVYAGNLGYAQNIEVIIKAAEILQDNKNIQFVVFGKGTQEEEYKKQATGLSNISFFPIQPYSEVSYVYSLGDVSLVTCKQGFGESAMPSKTWSIMACNTPIIASFDINSELGTILKKSNAGICVEPDNAEKLAEAILNEYQNPQIGRNGRRFIETHISRNKCVGEYISVIKETV